MTTVLHTAKINTVKFIMSSGKPCRWTDIFHRDLQKENKSYLWHHTAGVTLWWTIIPEEFALPTLASRLRCSDQYWNWQTCIEHYESSGTELENNWCQKSWQPWCNRAYRFGCQHKFFGRQKFFNLKISFDTVKLRLLLALLLSLFTHITLIYLHVDFFSSKEK